MRLAGSGTAAHLVPGNDVDRLAHWFEWVWHQGCSETVGRLFPEHGEAHGLGDQPIRGPEEFCAFQRAFFATFGTPRFEFHQLFEAHGRIVLHATIHVVDRGEKLQLRGVAICRMENGQIAEAWNHFDFLPVLMNRGFVTADDLATLFTPPQE